VQQPNYSTSAKIIHLKSHVASNFKLNLWLKENWNLVEIWKFPIDKCAIDLIKGNRKIFNFCKFHPFAILHWIQNLQGG
jgi:hypothetical protein